MLWPLLSSSLSQSNSAWPTPLHWLAGLIALGGLALPAGAQGLDCQSAAPIAGLGTFAYDNQTGGTSAFGQGTTCVVNSNGNGTERYFQWTATAPGDFQFRLSVDHLDRRLGVFEGSGCQAACLGSANPYTEPGNLQWRQSVLGVVPGDTFLLRIGNSHQPGGVGTLEVTWDPCFPPQVIDDAFEDNDTCASAVPLPVGTHPGLFASPADEDHFLVTVPGLHHAELTYSSFSDPIIFQSFDATCQPEGVGQFTWQRLNLSHAPVTLRVQTRPFQGAACAVYDLTLTLTPLDCGPDPGGDDALEDNDACDQAIPLTPGTYAGLFASRDDRDFYAIPLGPGEELVAEASSGANPLAWQRWDTTCELIDSTHGTLRVTNFTQSSQTVVVSPLPPFAGNEPWCAGYDMTLSVQPNPCASIGPGVLFEHPTYRDFSSATLPALYLDPSAVLQFCIPPGSTWNADLELLRADGVLQADLLCLAPLGPCFFLPVFASGSGQSFSPELDESQSRVPLCAVDPELLRRHGELQSRARGSGEPRGLRGNLVDPGILPAGQAQLDGRAIGLVCHPALRAIPRRSDGSDAGPCRSIRLPARRHRHRRSRHAH